PPAIGYGPFGAHSFKSTDFSDAHTSAGRRGSRTGAAQPQEAARSTSNLSSDRTSREGTTRGGIFRRIRTFPNDLLPLRGNGSRTGATRSFALDSQLHTLNLNQ